MFFASLPFFLKITSITIIIACNTVFSYCLLILSVNVITLYTYKVHEYCTSYVQIQCYIHTSITLVLYSYCVAEQKLRTRTVSVRVAKMSLGHCLNIRRGVWTLEFATHGFQYKFGNSEFTLCTTPKTLPQFCKLTNDIHRYMYSYQRW